MSYRLTVKLRRDPRLGRGSTELAPGFASTVSAEEQLGRGAGEGRAGGWKRVVLGDCGGV